MVNRNSASTPSSKRAIDRQRNHLCNYDGPAHQPTLALSYGSGWDWVAIRRGGVGYYAFYRRQTRLETRGGGERIIGGE